METLRIEDVVSIPASQLEALLNELEVLKAEVAALKQPPSLSTHWKTGTGEWIRYSHLKDSHLFNILNRMDNLEDNPRANHVIREAIDRWGDVPVTMTIARQVVCARAEDWARERSLGNECQVKDLLNHINCTDKSAVLNVIKHALVANGAWKD